MEFAAGVGVWCGLALIAMLGAYLGSGTLRGNFNLPSGP